MYSIIQKIYEKNNKILKEGLKKVLRSIDGVEEVEVSLENKKAIIKTSKQIENSKIKETIEDIGFSVNQIQ